MEICKINNLVSPLYQQYKRDGCTLCPNAPKREREQWFREFPEAIPLVKELQQRTWREPIKGRARGDSRRIHHARANPEAVHERLRTERTD